MIVHLKFVLALLILVCTGSSAQELTFGEVSKETLLEQQFASDSSASAAVLVRDVSVKFYYVPSYGFHVITYVHERIKIYNTRGFKYATVRTPLHKHGSTQEVLGNLKGTTYNLENGSVIKTKIKGSDTFNKSMNTYYNEEAFTMPNVKAGSIIEYQYRLDSPFSYSIDEIALQYDIPIVAQEVSISFPEFYSFTPRMKGYLAVNPTYSSSMDKISIVSRDGSNRGFVNNAKINNHSMDYRVSTTRFRMKDIPALKEEPFVNDMDNYRSSINYELQYVQFPQSARENYTTNWEEVVKTIYDNEDFGRQLGYAKYFKEPLAGIITEDMTATEKAAAIYQHVQQRMVWNGYRGFYTEKGVKDAYEEHSGNTADINLILVSMLQAAGLPANPVLISTRDHGVPLFPTREGFNYVIAALEMPQGIQLFDASNKSSVPNILPTQVLNWNGKIIREDGSFANVSVMPKKLSKEIGMMNVSIKENGAIEGKIRKTYTDYRAYAFRTSNNTLGKEEYLEKLQNSVAGLVVSDYGVTNAQINGKPLVETYDFMTEDQVQQIGEHMYFTPLFHYAVTENPFRRDERNYPIDFNYPWQDRYVLNIELPKGYKVAELPKDLALRLENDLGSFTYKIQELEGGQLQLLVDMQIKEAIIPAQQYASLKEFYKKIVEKQSEKVVLSKIVQDEYTERAAGGR